MIDPVLFELFGFKVYWYGISYAVAFLFYYFYIMHFGKRLKLDKDRLENIFLYTMIFSVLGGRMFEIIFYNLSYYLTNPIKFLAVSQGGMSIHGGFFASIVCAYYFGRKYNINYLKLLDIIAIPSILGLAFGRLANFVNQELVGKITTSTLGVVFPLYDKQIRWPTTIFESIKNMAIFQILFCTTMFKKTKTGFITAWFFILYNFGRFFIDFLREPDVNLGIISMGQLLCLIFGFYGIYILISINNKSEQTNEKINREISKKNKEKTSE